MTPPPDELPPLYFPGGQRLAFFGLLAAILAMAWIVVQPFAVAMLLAVAVTSLSYPLYRRLVRRLGGRPSLAAALMLLGVLVGVLGPTATIAFLGARRVALEIAAQLPRLPEAQAALLRFASHLGPLRHPARHAVESIGQTVSQAAPRLAQNLSGLLGTAGGAVADFAVNLFLFSVAVYHLLLNAEPWRERFIRLLPIPPAYTRRFIARFREVSTAVLLGNVGTAVIHGVIAGLGYLILGVDGPVLWAVATAFASFIPLFGTALVWGPLALVLGVTHGPLRGVLLAGYGIIVVGLSDNVARPLLMERQLGVHPLFVFLAVFGGLASFGFAGLFLGPLIMALTVAALDLYEQDPAPPAASAT